MNQRFQDRAEAGRLLASKLRVFKDQPDLVVLALPRGGVPVGAEVARALRAPLDVFVVRKLGLPDQPELAMGAIATGGVRVLNHEVIDALRVPDHVIDAVAAEETKELHRRESAYRDGRLALDLRGKTVILVDDGIATGSTMLAAVAALRNLHTTRIVVAAPVIALSTYAQIDDRADEVVAVIAPRDFYGVGEWYDSFSQTTDDEVRRLLAKAHQAERAAAFGPRVVSSER